MPLYDFVCPAGHTSELLRPRNVEVIACSCGLAAGRTAVNRVGFSGFAETPRDQKNYRQSYNEFIEARAEVGYAYNRRRQTTGETVPMPDYDGIAAQRVREMT